MWWQYVIPLSSERRDPMVDTSTMSNPDSPNRIGHSIIHRSGRWPDLDPHAADRRCSQVSKCTQNTLLRFLLDEESRNFWSPCAQVPSGQGMSVMVEHHVNWTWIPSQPILDSLSNDSKRNSSKWSRYMAERPKTTSLPVIQLRWIRSATGSLIPLL